MGKKPALLQRARPGMTSRSAFQRRALVRFKTQRIRERRGEGKLQGAHRKTRGTATEARIENRKYGAAFMRVEGTDKCMGKAKMLTRTERRRKAVAARYEKLRAKNSPKGGGSVKGATG